MKLTMPAVACLLLLMESPLAACLWDFDTIKMETQRFPGTLELITGKFLRHSKPFYEWRIEDRQKRIAEAAENDESVAALYDDLSVAQEKTGQTEAAIETMLKKEELWPGQYTTQANLGTFYIHSGQLEKGLEHIERAIEINPDAHFGREVYQKLLVEYVLSKQVDGETRLPLEEVLYSGGPDSLDPYGFAEFVLNAREIQLETADKSIVREELDRAIAGVKGMMHFGNYRSPVLLEALAHLLVAGDVFEDAGLLACRACLAASMSVEEPDVKETYLDQALQCLEMQELGTLTSKQALLNELEETFRKEVADADAWYRELSRDEQSWIERGLNPEAEFERKYRSSEIPKTPIQTAVREAPGRRLERRLTQLTLFVGCTIVVVAGLVLASAFSRTARRKATTDTLPKQQ